jgi:hypothetical protein
MHFTFHPWRANITPHIFDAMHWQTERRSGRRLTRSRWRVTTDSALVCHRGGRLHSHQSLENTRPTCGLIADTSRCCVSRVAVGGSRVRPFVHIRRAAHRDVMHLTRFCANAETFLVSTSTRSPRDVAAKSAGGCVAGRTPELRGMKTIETSSLTRWSELARIGTATVRRAVDSRRDGVVRAGGRLGGSPTAARPPCAA